jgi:hypothetical protein
VSRRSYLVECYWPDVRHADLVATVSRARSEAESLCRHGGDVFLRELIHVPVDESIFCLFDGEESDVRSASHRAGLPVNRVVELVRIGDEPDPAGESP